MSHRVGRYSIEWRQLLAGFFVAFGIGATQPAVALPKNTVVATIAVGEFPEDMVITPNGQTIYVTNYQSGNVSVIDTASNTVTTSIALASYPGEMAITPDGLTVFANYMQGLAVISTATNTVTGTVQAGGATMAVSHDGFGV